MSADTFALSVEAGRRGYEMRRKNLSGEMLDKALKGMFGALKGRALPDRLTSVVEQLDEGEAATAKPKRKRA